MAVPAWETCRSCQEHHGAEPVLGSRGPSRRFEVFDRFVSKEVNVSAVRVTPPAHRRSEIDELHARVAQLQAALESRVAIEQAKGVLMERFTLTPDAAFVLLRRAARNSSESLHKLAALVTASSITPASIEKVRCGA